MELLLPDSRRIRYLRENRKHYSQAGLAEAAHCSIGTIVRMEQGLATSPGTLSRVAKALDAGVAEITRNKDWTRDLLSNHQIVTILDRIYPAEPEGMSPVQRQRTAPLDMRGQGVLSLLRSLGIIELDGQELKSVSEIADAFLQSLRTFLRNEGRNYPEKWNTPTVSSTGRKLAAFIRAGEEHRLQTSRTPARLVRAALALIRADYLKEPRFLMLQEPTWKPEGGWWFIGGIEKSCDNGDLAQTMRREIREELALEETALLKVRRLGHTTDFRFSGRLGLFTKYEYHLFEVRGDCPALQKLLVRNPAIEIHAPQNPGFSRIHQFAWFSWNQLLQSEHLAENAVPLLSLLNKIDPIRLGSVGKLPRMKQQWQARTSR